MLQLEVNLLFWLMNLKFSLHCHVEQRYGLWKNSQAPSPPLGNLFDSMKSESKGPSGNKDFSPI